MWKLTIGKNRQILTTTKSLYNYFKEIKFNSKTLRKKMFLAINFIT